MAEGTGHGPASSAAAPASGRRRRGRGRHGRSRWFAAARRVRGAEPLLVLLAAPLLLLYERLGPLALAAGAVWLAILWALRRVIDGRLGLRLVIDAPVLALLATVPSAVLAATERVPAVSRAASLLFAVAVAYAVANGIATPRRAWRLVGGLLLGAAALAAVGALGVAWPHKVGVLGALAERVPRVLPAIPHAVFGRVAGTSPSAIHPNMLAGLLAPFVPLAAACLMWPRPASADGRAAPRWVRGAAALCLTAALPVLALTQSRGAWLALAAALAWLARQRWPARAATGRPPASAGRWLAAAALATAVAAGAWLAVGAPSPESGRGAAGDVGPAAAASDASASAAGVAGRLALWSAAAALLAESPARGIGLHQFALRFGQVPDGDFYVYQGYAHAHNQLLQAALDYGLPGLAAVAGLYAALVVACLRARRHTAGTPLDALVVGAAAGLMAHALHGLVDAVAIGAKPGFVTWALVGLLAGARARARRWGERAPRGTDAVSSEAGV